MSLCKSLLGFQMTMKFTMTLQKKMPPKKVNFAGRLRAQTKLEVLYLKLQGAPEKPTNYRLLLLLTSVLSIVRTKINLFAPSNKKRQKKSLSEENRKN